jgi:sulfur-oxidizing protein SoxZ
MNRRAHVRVPRQAVRGELIHVKTKLEHPMETGWREDASGRKVPRKRIHSFACRLGPRTVFRAQFHAGVSADPYLSFYTRATQSGVYEFTWTEDGGAEFKASAAIEVVEEVT